MEEVIKLNALEKYNNILCLETLNKLVSVVELSEDTG